MEARRLAKMSSQSTVTEQNIKNITDGSPVQVRSESELDDASSSLSRLLDEGEFIQTSFI